MSPLCTLTVTLYEGSYTYSYVAADGVKVTLGQWALAHAKLTLGVLENVQVLIPDAATKARLDAETEAARALPEGWEPTLDGVGVTLEMGRGMRHTRTYLHASGFVAEAPCDAEGASLPETRIALLAATPETL